MLALTRTQGLGTACCRARSSPTSWCGSVNLGRARVRLTRCPRPRWASECRVERLRGQPWREDEAESSRRPPRARHSPCIVQPHGCVRLFQSLDKRLHGGRTPRGRGDKSVNDVRGEFSGATASCYALYRRDVPDTLIEAAVRTVGLTDRDVALDLGCGTGQVAVPLSPYTSAVLAIDPEPNMLASLRARLAAAEGCKRSAGARQRSRIARHHHDVGSLAGGGDRRQRAALDGHRAGLCALPCVVAGRRRVDHHQPGSADVACGLRLVR